jgi:hypothetical protein
MDIQEHVAPPANYRQRQNYAAMIAALTTCSGNWIAVPLADLPGTRNATKQNAVIQAAKQRGLKIETTCQGQKIFLRLRPEGR